MAKKKARMGRPPLGKDARRLPVLIRISTRERAEWKRRAKAEGLGLGPWIAKPRREEGTP